MIPNATRVSVRLAAFLALAAVSLLAPRAARAQEDLIPPKTLDRRFPAFQFCPFQVSLPFVANGNVATLEFKGNVFAADPVSTVSYCGQGIDDIAVCPTNVFAPNFGLPPAFSDASRCYTGNKVGSFFFNRPGLSLQLLELFDTDPVVRGWDTSHGAFFQAGNSGPRDPENDADYTGGCLRLGANTPGGTPADTAVTSVQISGLVSGQSYTLSGWWYVQNIPQDQNTFDPIGNVTLVVSVFGNGSTPLARRSWGALKAGYR